MAWNPTSTDLLCINTIRTLSIDAIQKAKSGHPGLPLGAAPMAYVLWQNHLKHDPKNSSWPDRDRFVLSAGHGSMLIYSLLHLTGYPLPMTEIQNFRQWGSKTPGHPEFALTSGVEATTGPLGQGTANAVGMAIAERALAYRYNRPGFEIVNHMTYALVSDGDLMEGISAEAASMAGHLKLGKLIYLYDANDITLDGPTSLTFSTEDVAKRYESYGWHVQTIKEGNTDLVGLDHTLHRARAETTKPSLMIVKTTIGYGSPNKKGTAAAHGSPLGPDEVALTKKTLGWDPEKHFYVPTEATAHFSKKTEQGGVKYQQWKTLFEGYKKEHPELAREWELSLKRELPAKWNADLPIFDPKEKPATRQASGKVLNRLSLNIPWLMGGDADLSCSTNSAIQAESSFDGQTGKGRNIHFGVREHAMTAIANGMSYHGGVLPYVSTFFCFSDYMKPAIRLAAMNHLPQIYVWTHDSIGLGEDGPTHQPVEHLMALRVVPNLWTLRPADANETVEAWKIAVQRKDGPVGLVLTRQELPVFDRKEMGPAEGVHKGAYILKDSKKGAPQVIFIATGSEVQLAVKAQDLLEQEGISSRVVSMPCWELFMMQNQAYRDQVLPPNLKARISIEAGRTLGWEKWVGNEGRMIGVDRSGASAPQPVLFEQYGLTVQNVFSTARGLLHS